MIKGELYRPMVLSGKASDDGYCMGKLIINSNVDFKENMIQVLHSDSLLNFSQGYHGYLFESSTIPSNILSYLQQSGVPFLTGVNYIDTLVNNDIVEIISSNSIARVLFRANSDDNVLIATNGCNCNCVMCPEPLAVRQGLSIPLDRTMNYLMLIDSTTRFLCITGGEPTLLKEKLFLILDECKRRLPNTNFTVLTNARMFAYKNYMQEFNQHRPEHIMMGVPLYGHTAEIHDSITNTTGSFSQTVNGIKNLLNMGIKVEIRIVASKLNYLYLCDLSNYIVKHYPTILRVNIMGLEMLGNAIVNKDKVWVGYDELRDYLREATLNFIRNGIETYLYNFPLCFVDQNLWSITLKSISDYKVRYFDECEECKVKEKCGGFFHSTINLKELKVNPII